MLFKKTTVLIAVTNLNSVFMVIIIYDKQMSFVIIIILSLKKMVFQHKESLKKMMTGRVDNMFFVP